MISILIIKCSVCFVLWKKAEKCETTHKTFRQGVNFCGPRRRIFVTQQHVCFCLLLRIFSMLKPAQTGSDADK